MPRKLALLYSTADQILTLAFPEGQAAARLLGYDSGGVFAGGDYDRAVGVQGEPVGLTAYRGDMSPYNFGHGSDWGPKRAALNVVAPLLGIAVPRGMVMRAANSRATPTAVSLVSSTDLSDQLPPPRGLPTRLLATA